MFEIRLAPTVLMAGSLLTAATCRPMPDPPPTQDDSASAVAPVASFQDDVAFLERHMDLVVLGDVDGGPRVAVAPRWQGRVMTSAADGARGIGYGWINEALIASGELQPHINAIGGEDRFWLGPEGGQFSIFFAGGDPFDLDHWQTPAALDSEPYEIREQDASQVTLTHSAALTNYSGTEFDVRVDRTVRLIDTAGLEAAVPAAVQRVAYQSVNTITNVGAEAWTADSGLLSIWILGMFKHSAESVVVIPFRPGPEDELGPIVNDAYFGKVPDDRLAIADGRLFFRADGTYRSKIGLGLGRAEPVLGSYDAARQLLTLVTYDRPENATQYVNSMWELQDEPYAGDVVNSYNDGPPAPGAAPLGPFYELETSSPAAALSPNEALTHTHTTYHFEGAEADLDAIARSVLGVSLDAIRTALP
ncbi:MAG: hypothetical protein QF634_06200 [Vicinamibacterales bacterium]|jgi:hypothetical protein|nr:hypothetical protein [Vicinamibacterales bacterium]